MGTEILLSNKNLHAEGVVKSDGECTPNLSRGRVSFAWARRCGGRAKRSFSNPLQFSGQTIQVSMVPASRDLVRVM